MYDRGYCPNHRLEPPNQEEYGYICPVCGEELWEENWVYCYKGQMIGCENCVERLHPYEGLEVENRCLIES